MLSLLFLFHLNVRRNRIKYIDNLRHICYNNYEYIPFDKEELIKCIKTIESIKTEIYIEAYDTLYELFRPLSSYSFSPFNSTLNTSTSNNLKYVFGSIPNWVVDLLKILLQKVITYIINNYAVEISWTDSYRDVYKACIISLIHKNNNSALLYDSYFSKFEAAVSNAVQYYIIGKFPVHLSAEMYNGNPSVIIYWS